MGRAAEERRSALGAERLREALVRLPLLDELVAGGDPDRAGGDAHVGRGGGARPPLAALAVAVLRRLERVLCDLEPNGSAHASAREHPTRLTTPKNRPAGPQGPRPLREGRYFTAGGDLARRLSPIPSLPRAGGSEASLRERLGDVSRDGADAVLGALRTVGEV